MSLARKMSDQHESYLAGRLGWKVQPGSGNQWAKQGDVVGNRYEDPYAFTFDCKATRGNSIGVTADMWEKVQEQAGGNRPALALRWYGDDHLRRVRHDLVVISLEDFIELLEEADGRGTERG